MLSIDGRQRRIQIKILSLIIDGMDQSKTDIPHIINNPKVMSGAYRHETHVTGVRVHGRFTMMFIDCRQFSHDSNLTIEILLRTFHQLKVFFYWEVSNLIIHVRQCLAAGHIARSAASADGQHLS